MGGRFLSIGECMVELSHAGDGLLRRGFAGDTLNTAWYARACLSADWSVDYFTALGDDGLSDAMVEFFRSAGIGVSTIHRIVNKSPGLYLIDLKDGERSFSYWRESSAARHLATDLHHLRRAIDAADVIYFSGITLAILPAEDAQTLIGELHRAKAAGKTVAFDPNIRPRLWQNSETMLATISAGAQAATIVMPSFDDEASNFGDKSIDDTASRYRSEAAMVIVKNGAGGAVLATAGGTVHVSASIVSAVVDTTGAGDSFNGAFLAHFCQFGDAQTAAGFAALIASTVIGAYGALLAFSDLPIGVPRMK